MGLNFEPIFFNQFFRHFFLPFRPLKSGFLQKQLHFTMRLKLLRLLTVVTCIIHLCGTSKAQSFSFNCSRDTIVPGCPANLCITLKSIIPDIHGQTNSYAVNPTSPNAGCFPVYSDPGIPGTGTNLITDDIYSTLISVGFPFPFYGSTYNDLKVSSNGYVTFNTALTGFSHYGILNSGGTLSGVNGTGSPQNLPSSLYAQAIIMGPYHDIDVGVNTSSTRRIQYTTVGVAPHRRWVLSYYKIPLYGTGNGCGNSYENTHQIVMYESTGIIEVLIFSKQICLAWNEGRAMIGLQDFSRTQAIMVNGRRASDPPWGSIGMNESWRFVPIGGPSLLKRVELYDLLGNLISTGTTIGLGGGQLEASFPNLCAPAGAITSYVVKSVYEKIDDPLVEIFGTDTVRVNRSVPLTGTATSTPAGCGLSTGTITVSGVAGGTAPYEYSLDGIIWQSSNVFSGLNAGSYTVFIRDFGSVCTTTLPVTVGTTGTIPATTTTTPTACAGVNDGSITITSAGGSGPYIFFLDGGAPVAGTIPFTFSNLSAGNHTILVTDQGLSCSSVLMNVNVPAGIGITGLINTAPTSCPGAANGSITATALSGVPPFMWQLDAGAIVPGASPYTFTNVTAGAHVVRITDNLGCISFFNANVAAGPGINGTASSTATTCPAVANGTVTATALTGTAPFTWSLDGAPPVPGASPYTFINVAAGLHTVTITDNIGCNIITTVNVLPGPGINGTANSTPTSCPAVANGTVTATALTGTAPFTWQLDGGATVPGASPYTFTNVAAGPHTVTITDNVGCNTLVVVSVAAGAGINGSAVSTATSCPAASNGTVTATALTGTAPFTWQLDGGAIVPGASPYTFTNVAAGPHTVTIIDNVGCNVLVSVTVNAGAGITANLSSTATACTGVPNGTITANATTGTAPYTYQLDGGAPQSGANPYTFTNVPAGLHTITVTDNVGCSFTNTETVAVGPGVSGNVTSTATSCPAAANGTITADATAGTAPFTYQLDAGAPQTGANPYTFTNVTAGAHTVVIIDNFGCNTVINVNVTAGPPLNATLAAAATSCSGAANGTITATPTNGSAPYTFALDGGAPVAGAAPYTFTNVAAGNHTVVVADAAGCISSSLPVIVNAGPLLTTTVSVTDALCNGGATGTITIVQPVIGNPPYQYSLDGITWQASNIFNGLIAGNYTAHYRESNGCQGSQPVIVSEPAAMSSAAATVAAVCNGDINGTITITAGGGLTPYQYSINGGVNWQPGNVFTVGAGAYTIIIRDANNCTVIQPATVTQPAVLAAASVNSNASCDGGNDGVITVNAVGGNAGYTYSIDGVNFQPSNIFNVAPGNYNITVNDNLGCSTTFPTTVGLTNNLTFTPQIDPTICEGNSTPLQLVSNATVYSWVPSTGLSNTTISNPDANPIVTTQYTVTATLGRCTANDIVMVNVNAAPIPDAGPPGFICYGQTYTLQGSGGVQYTWTPSTNLSSSSISNPVSAPVKTITYTLSEVIDAIGCKSLTTDQVTVDVTPPIKVKTFPYDTIGYPGDQIQLNATSAATIYSWSPSVGLSDPNIPNPVLTVGPIGSDVLYRVTASTAAGCKGEGYVTLKVYKGPELYVPSAFTPNGDGLNEIFYPFPVGIKSINYFKVFNRWGQLVFSSTALYKGWDGKLQGVEQPTGVYVFMAQGVDKNGKVLTRNGTAALIR
jgi:gliding motility-associated-like protein